MLFFLSKITVTTMTYQKKVKSVIGNTLNFNSLPGQQAIADQLHMTTRTLARRLRAENTSFKQVLDLHLEQMITPLIDDCHYGIEDVALRSGYATKESFTRAFCRWKGVTPTEYRHRLVLAATG
jgi:AraC-like DNA-binding protein